MKRVAFYLRVSKQDRQDVDRQHQDLLNLLEREPDAELRFIYKESISGSNQDRPKFKAMLREARNRSFDELWFWAFDRFSREGVLKTLVYLERLEQYGVKIRSYSEPIVNTCDPEFKEFMIAFLAIMAKRERTDIIDRTNSGLRRAKAKGKALGRKPGSKDKKPRRKSGYLLRWQKEQ
jgi:DNA invertase Pin-like site-specific DNA recombinase